MFRNTKSPSVGQMMPEFELPTPSGEIIKSASFRNRNNLVVIFFGDISQELTKRYIGDLTKRYKEFLDQDTRILLIMKEDQYMETDPSEQNQFPFPILLDKDGSLHKAIAPIEDMSQLNATAYIIDRFGELISIYFGENGINFPNLDELIAEVTFIALQCPE